MMEYRHRTQVREMHRQRAELPPRIYSLAILLEGRNVGTRLIYTDEYRGQGTRFTCPIIELERWQDRWDELDALAPSHPFAVVVMAQLQANRHRNKRTRLEPKLDLIRRLRGYRYDRAQAAQICRLIDWMIALPDDLVPGFRQALVTFEKEEEMAFVTSIERWGIEKGLEQGLQAGRLEGRTQGQADLLLRQIQRRFGPVDAGTVQRIRAAQASHLETWSLNILDAATLDDVFRD